MKFDWTELSFSGISERIWRIFLFTITALLVFFTYYCVSRGITTIFMHLYYFPIIIFAYRYQKKGVLCSALLGVSYVLMVVYFNPLNGSEIIGAVERFITFMGVALIIAYLSIHLKRKQSEIQRLSQFQENIISNALVWLTVLDSKGTILVWNKAAEDISGYLAGEVVGKNSIWKQLYPDMLYRKNITGTIRRIINENKYFEHFESVILTKKGDLRIISWNTRAIPSEQGVLPSFVAIGTDITERKQAEDALKESEARYSALFYHNNTVSLLIDPDTGMIVDANSAACTYYGYTREQLTGMRIFDLNRLPAEKVLRDLSVAKNEKERHFFSNHFLASGERRNVEIFSGPITVRGKPLFYSIIHDITDRKKAEAALKESEHQLAEIIDHLPDATLVIDRAGKVVAWNKAIEEMTGVKAQDMVGKGNYEYALPFYGTRRPILVDLIFESDEVLERKYYNIIQRYGDLIIAETDLPQPLGRVRTLWGKASPLYDEKGNKTGAIETIRDVTERKKAEDRLRSFNEELERGIAERTAKINASLQEKVVLLREIHHRVKNNLQIVISLLNLQTRQIDDENVKKMLQESQNRIKVMALVHEKLYRSEDLSHIILSEYIRNLVTILLDYYVLDRGLVTAKIEMKDITLNIDTAIPIGLMVNELISNSLKHAFPEGRKGEIEISIKKTERQLTIIYKDNGVGIPEGFDWRNAPSLGLRLVISLVEQLSGTIGLDRAKGTMFTIIVKEK
ncbi:MAG: PAS domain S-box protein [Methanoregula sp.]|nr:MAG: PAS domain S-box protein [Methanoregula sp.]